MTFIASPYVTLIIARLSTVFALDSSLKRVNVCNFDTKKTAIVMIRDLTEYFVEWKHVISERY